MKNLDRPSPLLLKAITWQHSFVVLLIVVFFVLDYHLYFVGQGYINYRALPHKVVPVSRPMLSGGFYIKDATGIPIIAKGQTSYGASALGGVVAEIVEYGYTDTCLIVVYRNMEGHNKSIGFLMKPGALGKSKQFQAVLDIDYQAKRDDMKWVRIHNEKMYWYKDIQHIILLVFVIMSVMLIIVHSKSYLHRKLLLR